MPILAQKKVIAAKIESTLGAAETLAAADAGFKAYTNGEDPLRILRETTRTEQNGGWGSATGVVQGATTELSFYSYITGKGSSGVPVWASTFLPACGMSLSTATYAQTTTVTDWKTITAAAYTDGLRTIGRGMMGTWTIRAVAGKAGIIEFRFVGGWEADPDDETILSGMSYESTKPPIWGAASSFTLASSTSFVPNEVTIEQGCELVVREDPNSKNGYLCGWIASRRPIVRMDPESMAVATKCWHADQTAATESALSLVFNGGTNNTVTIAATKLQIGEAPTHGERGGRRTDNLVFYVNEDALTVAFT